MTRFGFELIEDLIKEYSNGEIIIEEQKDEKEPEEELVDDVLQILNVYTAKMNELRKYKNKKHVIFYIFLYIFRYTSITSQFVVKRKT